MKIHDGYLPDLQNSGTIFGMTNIRELRNLRNLTQQQLADLVGIRQPHMSRIEKGDEGPPLELFRKIADALNVTLPELFEDQKSAMIRRVMDAMYRLPDDQQKTVLAMIEAAANQPDPSHQQD